MSNIKNIQLTVSVGLIERDSKFLLTRRVAPHNWKWHHRWEFPGGKIAPGETPIQALLREINEETSLKITQPKLLGVHTHHWEIPNGIQQTFILFYHCYSNEGKVVLDPSASSDFGWFTFEEITAKEDLLEGVLQMLMLKKELDLQILS